MTRFRGKETFFTHSDINNEHKLLTLDLLQENLKSPSENETIQMGLIASTFNDPTYVGTFVGYWYLGLSVLPNGVDCINQRPTYIKSPNLKGVFV